MAEKLLNFVDGAWRESAAERYQDVVNPATTEVIATVPLSPPEEVDRVARLAAAAFAEWRRTPAPARIQHLFKLKTLMEDNFEDLARSITIENGKTLDDARGEMRRAIENVEVACGIPTMMMGDFSEDVARGVDEYMIRQPVGVAAIICPFNFPGMIPFWYLPYALATGNTVIVKPSERCPITLQKAFRLIEQCGFPKGVVNLVNGSADTVNAILDHPAIAAVTFVGSTPVARHIYARASANGKRVQAQGGAKNPLIILPDADVSLTTRIVTDSAFGNAGQRCLA
ncbi:MAG: aldehyde dehydrogenase family protein, partial [Caldilineaceae bacterium]|nr:aldehyde dehydrogenase family protein [Caldilineaceae bacterium]